MFRMNERPLAGSADRPGRSAAARNVGRVGALAFAFGVGSLFASVAVAAADTAGVESAGSPSPAATRSEPQAKASTRPSARSSHARQVTATRAGRSAATRPVSVPVRNAAAPARAANITTVAPASAPAAAQTVSAQAVSAQAVSAPAASAPRAAQTSGFTLPVGPVRAAILASQAYVYGYPLLAVQRVQALLGPLNTMNLNTEFANPNAAPFWKAIGGGTRPNVNVLYSLASLDLTNGPVVLSTPDMGDRYYSFQLTDPYINVDNYISSNPTTSNPIGGQGPGTYAITWVGNQIAVPGAQTVLVDYPSELLLGRVEATTANQQQVVDLMKQWTLNPTGATSANNAVIPSSYLSPISVLNAISTAITQNPPYPPAQDAKELTKLARIGVGPDPADPTTALQVTDRLGPLSQLAATLAVQATSALLPGLTDFTQKTSALRNHGWAVTKPEIGNFGTDYLYRAGVAYVGLVANTPDQALYYPGMLDSRFRPLKGKQSYVIHFAPGQTPPTDPGGFWSLTVYDSTGKLVNSTVPNVYSNGGVITRPDGSIDVVLSQQQPSDAGANWLQVPTGDFSVYLRIYAPEQAASEGTWLPPAIKRTSGLFGG